MKDATLPIKRLSDTPQICMLLYPAFYIIQEMSAKAAENLNWSTVIPAPGVLKESFVVQNSVSPMELLISNFKTSCKDKCKLYHGYQICEHCLAVAEKESALIAFLAYHKKRNTSKYKQTQISDVAAVGKEKLHWSVM